MVLLPTLGHWLFGVLCWGHGLSWYLMKWRQKDRLEPMLMVLKVMTMMPMMSMRMRRMRIGMRTRPMMMTMMTMTMTMAMPTTMAMMTTMMIAVPDGASCLPDTFKLLSAMIC